MNFLTIKYCCAISSSDFAFHKLNAGLLTSHFLQVQVKSQILGYRSKTSPIYVVKAPSHVTGFFGYNS